MKGIGYMIDVHSHIIFGVDDGPSCIEQSLEMLKEADRVGIRTIIATPHFHEPIFDLERVEENYQELLFRAKDYDIGIQLAYEVFINPESHLQSNNRRKFNLNKGELMLLEFPFGVNPQKCFENVCKLNLQNIIPIITHIERNRNFINEFGCVVSLIKAGCYIQVDAASIIGVYGSRIKEYTKKLIQMRLVDMVASNAHCADDYTKWYMQAYSNVIHWIGKDGASMLFHDNAKSLLEDNYRNKLMTYNNIPMDWKRPHKIFLQN
jgi:protein-tyrosine phosphatase